MAKRPPEWYSEFVDRKAKPASDDLIALPKGTRAGAKCLRDVVTGTLDGQGLSDIASWSPETKQSLAKWRRVRPQ